MSKFALKSKKQLVVDEETALAQFMLFVEFYELDLEKVAQRLSENDETGVAKITSDEIGDEYLELIMEGRISIKAETNGVSITQHFAKKYGDFDEITYGVLKGANRRQMNKGGNKGDDAVALELLGSVSNLNSKFLDGLFGVDLRVARQVSQIYFLV